MGNTCQECATEQCGFNNNRRLYPSHFYTGAILIQTRKQLQFPCQLESNLIEVDNQNREYVGQRKEGFPHGLGKQKWIDGTLYQGQWERGLPSGKGRLINVEGQCYTGQWFMGKKHGKGSWCNLNEDYLNGCWKQDLPHGYCQQVTSQFVYKGQFVHGVKQGKGIHVWKNVSIHGDETNECIQEQQQAGVYFLQEENGGENKQQNQGVEDNPSNYIKESFVYNKKIELMCVKQIKIKMEQDNNVKQEDRANQDKKLKYNQDVGCDCSCQLIKEEQFQIKPIPHSVEEQKQQQRKGNCELITKQGVDRNKKQEQKSNCVQIVYEGDFKGGYPHGKGKLEFGDGRVYEGQFQQGQVTGEGVMSYLDGSRYEGRFLNERRNGNGTLFLFCGVTWSGNWVDDEPQLKADCIQQK